MIPALSRYIIYPLQERLLGRTTFSYLHELEQSQWLDRNQLEALQLRKLTQLLSTALRHSPWHAERIESAALADSIRNQSLTLSDLSRLPTMTKADASQQRERIAWQQVPGGCHSYNTGGSSGQPLIFYFGRSRQASDAAGRMRAVRWWGVEPGDREVYLWGAPVELNKTDRIKTLRDRLINQWVLNAFRMSPADMRHYLVVLQQVQPRCIYGYASSLALLAAFCEVEGASLGLSELKVVCTTGEPLYPQQRALIQRVFGAPVANEFGSRDIGFTAHETPQGEMLLLSESMILEILDVEGRPVAADEIGEAVITGLCSEAQPFIRYRTGDMVRAADPAQCQDARGLHRIGEVIGRSTDFIVAADGTIMHALALIYVLRAVAGVGEFKIIQESLDDCRVEVVPTAGWQAGSIDAIRNGLTARLGSGVRFDVRLVDEIPPEASGKHRYVVSRVPLPAGLAGVLWH
ncbi:MAG: phenylacetate--CoA ligase family protein [Pseudomonadales bacterium]|nr:phenylacetate--CoA ligase family protein [Pseudomonadales bacterium]